MSPEIPEGMGGFFPGVFADLLKLLHTDAPIQWQLAQQLAYSVAAEAASEPNVEPLARIQLEELVRIAELHVADVTGMTITPGSRPIEVAAVNRSEWARRALEGWRWLIEDIAGAINTRDTPVVSEGDEDDDEVVGFSLDDEGGQNFAALLGQWSAAMGPAMLAMQVGSVVGHLAQRTLGQYELPLPRRGSDQLSVVPQNVQEFVDAWSLPPDDTALWLAAHDVATHAVLSRPHVSNRLAALLVEHAHGFRPDPNALGQRLNEVTSGDLGDIADLTRLLGDPSALAQVIDTPELRRVNAELDALGAAIAGYVEWVTDTVAERAVAGRSAVREAMRRRRLERGSDERVAEALFGLRLDPEQVDRGEAFIRGVIERGGEIELAKLWVVEANLPTPAEVDAPGLWIERVNLPSE